jgi:hypothetical protein
MMGPGRLISGTENLTKGVMDFYLYHKLNFARCILMKAENQEFAAFWEWGIAA